MELLDIYDNTGVFIGSKARCLVHADGDWHRTVHIWVLVDSRELVIQKRSPDKDSHPGLWDISCAGHIAAGESRIDAAIRELSEELHLMNCNPHDLHYLFTVKQFYENREHQFLDREFADVFLLEIALDKLTMGIENSEVSEIRLITPDALKEQLISDSKLYVDHSEEYNMLFEILDNL